MELDPNASSCADYMQIRDEVHALCNVINPPDAQVTCRLRNVTLGMLVAGPQVDTTVPFNLLRRIRPEFFPPPFSPGHTFRVCAHNNVAGQKVKVQLIINGQ